MKKTHKTLSGWMLQSSVIAVLLAASVIQSQAQTTISVANSSLQVNLNTGVTGWTVGGVNQLVNQSFFYSLAGVVYPLSQISAPSSPVFGGSSFGGVLLNTNVSTSYANSTLSLKTQYQLAQQGSGASLATTITIQNVSSTTQTLQFYQLSDFTLGGISTGQNVQFLGTATPFTVTQTGGGYMMTGSLSGIGLGSTVPVFQAAGNDNLGLASGNPAPNFSGHPLSATGSVQYGYEFQVTLAANAGLSISEIQNVPEPSSMALLVSGIAGLALLRRRGLTFFKK
ncbi:MAG TPA: PEP-CTERM sorting domain-containing protein [Pseudomonadales bacterium]|nr:PEP-CTERM sorting domain-containing protein [Pseudomonadales bacterium]